MTTDLPSKEDWARLDVALGRKGLSPKEMLNQVLYQLAQQKISELASGGAEQLARLADVMNDARTVLEAGTMEAIRTCPYCDDTFSGEAIADAIEQKTYPYCSRTCYLAAIDNGN